MSWSIDHAADIHARSLAEAVILQSIEDLWNPVCRKGSLLFFEGDGFALCSEIAGIRYIKQLVVLRMLAISGNKELRETCLKKGYQEDGSELNRYGGALHCESSAALFSHG